MPKSKLTDAQIAEIRHLYAGKTRGDWGVSRIARAFGTSPARVVSLCKDLRPSGYMGVPSSEQNLTGASAYPITD